MTTNMSDIRTALINNLSSITGCQKSAYRSGNQTPPSIIITGFGSQMERVAMGSYSFELLVQGLVGAPLTEGAERRMDDWLLPGGSQNVWAALESDKTLGGHVSYAYVSANDGTQPLQLDNGTTVLGTTWHVVVEL